MGCRDAVTVLPLPESATIRSDGNLYLFKLRNVTRAVVSAGHSLCRVRGRGGRGAGRGLGGSELRDLRAEIQAATADGDLLQ
jgi:hypothetical protein